MIDGLPWHELPEEVLFSMWTTPDHDTERPLEVGGIHHDNDLIRCEFFSWNHHSFQLSLHPLRTAPVLPGNVRMALLAMCEFFPNLLLVIPSFLTTLLAACSTFPDLSTAVGSVLL